ncbi:MAG: hypothetical protein ACU84Q_13275 [Gammaproteobacteria bacterium]
MPIWKRRLYRLILLSFTFRALVPLGLMLQLPVATGSQDGLQSESSRLAFVICPQQNPGLDLSNLEDSSQAKGAHAHHGHADHAAAQSDGTTISVDQSGSLCNLWSSSADSNLLPDPGLRFEQRSAALLFITTPIAPDLANQFPTRLTRAPPQPPLNSTN